jgi:hypothetical protein
MNEASQPFELSGFVRFVRVENDTLCRNQHGAPKVMGYA